MVITIINYIEINNRSLHVFEEAKNYRIETNLESFLNSILINKLTTYKGRIDAIKIKYRFFKNVPIFIDDSLCLINCFNKKNLDNIYINVKAISNFKKENNYIRIDFIDNSHLFVKKKFEIIKKYIDKANSISLS